MEKTMDFSPKPADWLKILRKKTGNETLDKVVERHKRKPKPQSGITPGQGSRKNRRNEVINPGGKSEPHKPSQ